MCYFLFVFCSFNSCQASKGATAVLFSVVRLFSIASTLVKRQRPLWLCCFFCCAFVFLYSFNSCQASMGATTVLFSVVRFLQLQLLSSVKAPTTPAVFVDVAVYSVVI
jgi:hypothetical protein